MSMSLRIQTYRGFRVRLDRQPSLGGWVVTSILVERNDGLVLIDEQTEAEDSLGKLLGYMRNRVDGAIASKGESECCEDWGRWKEPSDCTCGRISIAPHVRTWHHACPEHGEKSAWYKSPEQVQKRKEQSDNLMDLQRRAAEARAKSKTEVQGG